jgi:hypothetical protein
MFECLQNWLCPKEKKRISRQQPRLQVRLPDDTRHGLRSEGRIAQETASELQEYRPQLPTHLRPLLELGGEVGRSLR